MTATVRGRARRTRRAAVVVCAVLVGVTPAVAEGSGSHPRLVFRIHDERVLESSGLAVSRTHDGLAYTVNDSGDDARVFVVSTDDGSVVGQTGLAGARADDFEALATAPGGRLVVADIGDNGADRDSVELYVLPEPGRGVREVRPRTVTLTYPGGARDAEAVVVSGQTVFVVSKEALGGVYAAPVLRSGRDRFRLRRVASAPTLVTDATRLPDGDVVLRDYGRGYVVTLPQWRVHRSFRLPRTRQGETIAALPTGRRVYVGSEGSHSPVYLVAVPSATQAAGAVRTPRAGAGSGRRGEPGPPDPAAISPSGYVTVAVLGACAAVIALRRRMRGGRNAPTLR